MTRASPRGTIAAFEGKATVHRRAEAPLPFALEGVARDAGGEILLLAFTRAPAQIQSGTLTDLTVELRNDGLYMLRAVEGEFQIEAARHFLHRDVGRAFYRVLPPFEVPWLKRTLWRTILIAARLKL